MTEFAISHRRYCFLKYANAYRLNDEIWYSWDEKRRRIAGTDIPAAFPARIALITAGYLALEELQGATERELIRAGLTPGQAAAVLAAIG